MFKILSMIGASVAIALLNLSGPDEPAWLFPATMLLLAACIIIVGMGISSTTQHDQYVQHDQDEHRDNAV